MKKTYVVITNLTPCVEHEPEKAQRYPSGHSAVRPVLFLLSREALSGAAEGVSKWI